MKIAELLNESYSSRVSDTAKKVAAKFPGGEAGSKRAVLDALDTIAGDPSPRGVSDYKLGGSAQREFIKDVMAELKDTLKIKKAEPKARPGAKPKVDLWKVWRWIEDAVSNAVPDGDPIDLIATKMKRGYGLEYDLMPYLDQAVKKHYDKKSSYDKYLSDMWDLYNEMYADDPEKQVENPW